MSGSVGPQALLWNVTKACGSFAAEAQGLDNSLAPSLKPALCNFLNIRDSPLALRDTADLLVTFSPENNLADFPAGHIHLSPVSGISLRYYSKVEESLELSQTRGHTLARLPHAVSCQTLQSTGLFHTLIKIPLLRLCRSITAQNQDILQQVAKGKAHGAVLHQGLLL